MMGRRFQRVRHLNRYRKIAQVFIKHGFGDMVQRLGLLEKLSLTTSDPAELEDATVTAPQRFRMALDELGPTFIKLGQILSIRPDLLPPEYIKELEKLQDKASPIPWNQIRYSIEQELNGPMMSLFRFVESQPLATASLAQVHTARLLDGTDVVIKIQRPNIESTIDIDLEILSDVGQLMQTITPLGEIYNLPAIIDDFTYTLKNELDYEFEGQNADHFRHNFEGDKDVYIPKVYWDYTTKRILVMERLRGIKIDDVERLDSVGYDRHQIALKASRLIIKEVLEDGFFHADPHPGNLLVMQGEIIGVMDFGMVGWLDNNIRTQLGQLYIATVRRDIEGMVKLLIRIGVATPDVNRQQLQRDLTHLLRKYYGRSLQNIRVADFIGDILPIVYEHHLRFPTELWLLLKTLAIMEGVGKQLDPEFDIFAASQPFVKQLSGRFWSLQTFTSLASQMSSSVADLLITSPEITLDLLRRLERGQLKLMIEPTGMDQLMDRADRIANRVAASIVLAAMILGLSWLIPRLDGARTWIIFFTSGMLVFVLLIGAWLVISVLRKRK